MTKTKGNIFFRTSCLDILDNLGWERRRFSSRVHYVKQKKIEGANVEEKKNRFIRIYRGYGHPLPLVFASGFGYVLTKKGLLLHNNRQVSIEILPSMSRFFWCFKNFVVFLLKMHASKTEVVI